MMLKVSKSNINSGTVLEIPGSKSHTIRALIIGSLAGGDSEIIRPLLSDDAFSAVEVCKLFGADIKEWGNDFRIKGFGASPQPPCDVIYVGNSGTTLRLGISMACLGQGYSVFTGDKQIRSRPMDPLISALNELGGVVFSTCGNGRPPIVCKGRMTGGRAVIDAYSSQFLSSLLITCPLLERDSEISISRLYERPYAEMTLWWLDKQGIKYHNDSFKTIYIQGNQRYSPLSTVIPGDFSSATFFMVLAAISGRSITLSNLDMTDPQGDKTVLFHLENMGAKVKYDDNSVTVEGNDLVGIDIDMNSIPDALPAMAVAACFAKGKTRLLNVPQARYKETDRISVMCRELRKMGGAAEELPDGMVVSQSKLTGAHTDACYDHRIAMALAIAGTMAEGSTIIDTSESINITFPDFVKYLKSCGGEVENI